MWQWAMTASRALCRRQIEVMIAQQNGWDF